MKRKINLCIVLIVFGLFAFGLIDTAHGSEYEQAKEQLVEELNQIFRRGVRKITHDMIYEKYVINGKGSVGENLNLYAKALDKRDVPMVSVYIEQDTETQIEYLLYKTDKEGGKRILAIPEGFTIKEAYAAAVLVVSAIADILIMETAPGKAMLSRREEALGDRLKDKKYVQSTLNEILRNAANSGDISRVSKALAAGADVNAKDKDGNTSLHYAVKGGKIEAVKILISAGADVNIKGQRNKTPLDLAKEEDPLDRSKENDFKKIKIADLIRKHGGPSKRDELSGLMKKIARDGYIYRNDIEAVIKLAQDISPPPAIPEEARSLMREGISALKYAKGISGYAKAEKKLEEASKLAPWWADPYFNLGLVNEEFWEFDDAIENLELYLIAAPNSQDADAVKQKISDLHYAKKNLAEADEHLNRGRDLYNNAKDYHGSIREFKEAIRLVPDYARVHANLGSAYSKVGSYKEAIPELKEAIRLGEDAPYVYTALALAYHNLGELKKAISILEEGVLESDWIGIGRGHLHQKLGRYYYKDGQYEKALQQFREANGYSNKDVDKQYVQKMMSKLNRHVGR